MAYSVQVVPVSGASGPVFIGFERNLFRQGPVLRLVNRVLARFQTWQSFEGTHLNVIRVADNDVVFSIDVADFAAGRTKALAIAEEIRGGTFDTGRS